MPVRIQLGEATREYLAHCKARGLAPKTISCRASSLYRLQRTIGDVVLWTVEGRQVDRVFQQHDWSPGTRNQKLTHYKVFFTWARARGYMHRDSNPLFGWRMETLPRPDRLRIPHKDWASLFASCENQIETITVATGLYLFLRASEQQALKIGDVDLARGEIAIYRTKTKDYDHMPISMELDGFLRAHLTWLAEQGISDPNHYLIPTRTKPVHVDGKFASDTGVLNPLRAVPKIHEVVKPVLERAGYSVDKEGGHTLRRSGARAYFDQLASEGYDGALRRVQAMLGHSHSAMTEQYLGLNLDRRQRNKAISGKPMFPTAETFANVIPIRQEM